MQSEIRQIEQVVRKLQLLPPDRVSEVEDFIDFLSQRGLDRKWSRHPWPLRNRH